MQGLIWYRLPAPMDVSNWATSTLPTVMKGQIPKAQICPFIETSSTSAHLIRIKNTGTDKGQTPQCITIDWTEGKLVAFDAGNDFHIVSHGARSIVFSPVSTMQNVPESAISNTNFPHRSVPISVFHDELVALHVTENLFGNSPTDALLLEIIQLHTNPAPHTAETATNDLVHCFMIDGKISEQESTCLQSYASLRKSLSEEGPIPRQTTIEGLPVEFQLYSNGALAWHQKNYKIARQHWTSILQLPEEQRIYRSVWAAFMLGRRYLSDIEDHQDKAIKYLHLCRQLAIDGFTDSTGLAMESIGWEAQVSLKQKYFQRAMHLYLIRWSATPDYRPASVSTTCYRISESSQMVLNDLAQNPQIRNIVTVHFFLD